MTEEEERGTATRTARDDKRASAAYAAESDGGERVQKILQRLRSTRPFISTRIGSAFPAAAGARLMWAQREIELRARARGFHLVTDEVLDALPELEQVQTGLLHLLIRHTSASLALNENASPDVRRDFETWFDQAVPEDASYWTHTLEGSDDMPAHIKASLLGPTLTLPVRGGRLGLGTWQGIYLCEHRDSGGSRGVLATLWGE